MIINFTFSSRLSVVRCLERSARACYSCVTVAKPTQATRTYRNERKRTRAQRRETTVMNAAD